MNSEEYMNTEDKNLITKVSIAKAEREAFYTGGCGPFKAKNGELYYSNKCLPQKFKTFNEAANYKCGCPFGITKIAQHEKVWTKKIESNDDTFWALNINPGYVVVEE